MKLKWKNIVAYALTLCLFFSGIILPDQNVKAEETGEIKELVLGWHSGMIKEDKSLWMWGSNEQGQIGDGTTEDSLEPKKVLEGVKSIGVGPIISGAVKEDGSLWIWGYNAYGQIGDGTT